MSKLSANGFSMLLSPSTILERLESYIFCCVLTYALALFFCLQSSLVVCILRCDHKRRVREYQDGTYIGMSSEYEYNN